MINFSNVSKGYGDRILFQGATFFLGRGERWGVVGRNGSGKSTLFRLITGEESADSGVIAVPKHYRIGTLEQHIKFSEETILGETLLSLPLDERDQAYRAEIILMGLGFSLEAMNQDPHSLSGGYQLRVQLAKVLLSEPDCLLLDEPTNYLDIVAIRWLEEFLKQWPGELMLISHDKTFIDRIVTHTLGVYRHETRKLAGNTEKYYEQILAEEEIHEKTCERAEKKRAHLKSYIDRFGAKASKAAQAKSKEKALDRLPVMERLAAMANLSFSFKMAPFPGKRMIEVDHLSFSYDKNADFAIKDLSLHIQKGDRIAFIGKNGRGKSTLLSLLSGNLEATRATWWRSDNLRIGYFGQTHIQRLHPSMTIEDEISCANRNLTIGEVKSICGLMMFSGDLSSKSISVLSGGEKSRVLLGKILATPCNLLLLDEPTHHLDMESVEALLLAITHFPGAVIMVTHNEEILSQFGKRLVVCKEEGMHLFEGDYPTFLEKEGWEPGDNTSQKPKESKNERKEKRIQRAAKLKKIRQCEKAIEKAEETLAQKEKLLATALESGDGKAITKHSESITRFQAKIETLFSELETLS